ncbi:hypothetical protein K474DRAFT_1717289 [Panus rudis PR-1116 ss-1]|nr:hypothetical protein K474DRAFT_1717289 [Panus rudis PR-1116 ss-1]
MGVIPNPLFLTVLCFVIPVAVLAQGFTVPSGWRKSTSDLSFNDRSSIAKAAIDVLASRINGTSGQVDDLQYMQSAQFLSAIANYDHVVGINTRESTVLNNLASISHAHSGWFEQDQSPTFGLTAIHAYRAYGDQTLLSMASLAWSQAAKFVVSQTDIKGDVGTHSSKTVNYSAPCNGASNVGALFYLQYSDVGDKTDVNGATMGAWVALSAYLYEATNISQYAEAAELSSGWIINHLFNGTIILDGTELTNCKSDSLARTYNSGFFIEGLSVYTNLTNNVTWAALLNDMIATNIKFPVWTGDDGVITEGDQFPNSGIGQNFFGIADRGIFMRGLYEAWSRSAHGSGIADLIMSYMITQYNALLDLARDPTTNLYSPSWKGPAPTQLIPWGQLAALDTLNSAIAMQVNSTSTNDPSSHTTSPPDGSSQSTRSRNVALIAGVTVGVVVLLLVLLGGLFLLRKRNRRRTIDQSNVYIAASLDSEDQSSSSPDTFNSSIGLNQYPPEPFTSAQPLQTGERSVNQLIMQEKDGNGSSPVILTYGGPGATGSSSAIAEPAPHAPVPGKATSTLPNVSETQTPETSFIVQPSSVSHPQPAAPQNPPESISDLVQRLNLAMSQLPPGGIEAAGHMDDTEEPPRYSAV